MLRLGDLALYASGMNGRARPVVLYVAPLCRWPWRVAGYTALLFLGGEVTGHEYICDKHEFAGEKFINLGKSESWHTLD